MKHSGIEPTEPSTAGRNPSKPIADRGPSPSAAGAILLVLACALVPHPASAQRRPTTGGTGLAHVNSVKIEGTKTLKEGQIKKVLKTHTRSSFAFWAQKPLYRQDFLRADIEIIRQFAAQHGYLDAVVSGAARPDPDKDEVDVVYRVDEGPRSDIDSLTIVGAASMPRAEVDKLVTTKVGQPFNALRLVADRQALTNGYSDRGFFPTITPSWVRHGGAARDSTRSDSTRVAVRFDIVEGPSYHVLRTGVEGVTEVDTNVVRREILLQPGDPFSRDRLQRSSERLYKTTLFQVVDFKPTAIDTDKAQVSFQVRVRERPHRAVEAGVGVGSADGLRLLANWSHNNLWGKNRRLRVESQLSFGTLKGFHNAVTYTEPWLFGVRVSGSAGPYLDQSQVSFKSELFTQRRWGFSASATRELSRYATGSVGFDQQWSIAITEPNLPDSELVGFDASQFSTSRVSASWIYDRRDDDFDPHKGELYHAVGELAGTLLGGQGQFTKGTVSAARYLPMSRNRTFAFRVSAGGIAPFGEGSEFTLSKVPINDLYTTGGATTVRGYQEQSILGSSGTGGLMLILTNMEMRFTLSRVFGAALFLDGGNVWSRPREFKWGDFFPGKEPIDGNDYRWGVGGGVRLRTPVGPVRFDLGYRLKDVLTGKADKPVQEKGWNWHLSLGQAY